MKLRISLSSNKYKNAVKWIFFISFSAEKDLGVTIMGTLS